MYSNAESRKSADSLTPISPSASHRSDFPFHQRTSSTSLARPRRGSIASSIHSVGGSLDTVGGWGDTVQESGQNAISTLLQPPIVRTGLQPHTSAPASSAHKPPTAKDIPPVTLTNIPHIDPSEFKPYLAQVGALYDQLRRIKEDQEDGHEPRRKGSKHDDDWDDGHLRPGKRYAPSRKSSVSSISGMLPEAPSPERRRSSTSTRRAGQGPPPLSTIPNVYFDDDFHLENPRTFDIVSERSEVVRPAPGKEASNGKASAPRKALATNAILQEKLSWYMDTVEMHLISSISSASTTFFTALGSLKGLHTEAAESVDRIKALRGELQALDEEIATKGLEIVQKQRRQENLQQLHSAVLQLKMIAEAVEACESLVEDGQIEKALDSIDALEKLVAGERVASARSDYFGPQTDTPLRDLRGAHALRGIAKDIGSLQLRIGREYETKFVGILMGDLRRHVDSVAKQEVLMRWSSASARARGGHSREPSVFPAYMASTESFRAELIGVLAGLHRAKHLPAAAQVFREAALREVRNLVRRPLPSSNDDDNESVMSSSTMGSSRQMSRTEKSSNLARNLRALDPEDAEELLINIYTNVTETLRRLTTQVKVLLDVASSVGDEADPDGLKSPLKSPPFSPTGRRVSSAGLLAQEELHKAMDVSNLLGSAIDVAQDQIVRILRVRTTQSTQLSLARFLRYFTLNLHFANECEAISGRSGTTLKTVVNGQIKDFVSQHGDMEKQKLAVSMESDQWEAKDFTDINTTLLEEILEASTKDSASWVEMSRVWTPCSEDDSDNEQPEPDAQQANGTTKPKARSAVIDSESFPLPKSAIMCMVGISHFLHLMVGIPSVTADVSTSLVSYLQLFNSRCTQLILGAGATKSAGLKNINAKNLAIASQALGFIATLMPHVREFARRRAGSNPNISTVISDFDKVRRLYQEHQNQIYDKLIDIMNMRATAQTRQMEAMDWEAEQSEEGPVVHPYMDTLTKMTLQLHRALVKALPEGTTRFIMSSVFQRYKEKFGGQFRVAKIETEKGRESMLHDIKVFTTRLSKIDGFGDAGDYLLNIVTEKVVKTAPPPSPRPQEAEDDDSDEEDEKGGKDAAAERKSAESQDKSKTSSETAEKPSAEGK